MKKRQKLSRWTVVHKQAVNLLKEHERIGDGDWLHSWFNLLIPIERLSGIEGSEQTSKKGEARRRVRDALYKIRPRLADSDLSVAIVLPASKTKPDATRSRKLRLSDPNAAIQQRIQRFYRSYGWRKLRFATLAEYGRKCMCCGATEGTFHVDHIKPLRKYWGLRLDPDNMQVLCDVCNHGKGSWSEEDFRPIQRKPLQKRPMNGTPTTQHFFEAVAAARADFKESGGPTPKENGSPGPEVSQSYFATGAGKD